MPHDLEPIDRYFDAVARSLCDTEDLGPFTIYAGGPRGRRLYARPRIGDRTHATADDVLRVVARQAELDAPRELEWIDELRLDVGTAAETAGLQVERRPLLVHEREIPAPALPEGVRIRLVTEPPADLPDIVAALDLGFGHPGTGTGAAGPAERKAAADPDSRMVRVFGDQLAAGQSVMAVADGPDGPLAAGAHNPRGPATEVTGVATLPAFRRQGLAAAITVALCADARERAVELVFLSAQSDDVARVYERCGFVRWGHAGAAATTG